MPASKIRGKSRKGGGKATATTETRTAPSTVDTTTKGGITEMIAMPGRLASAAERRERAIGPGEHFRGYAVAAHLQTREPANRLTFVVCAYLRSSRVDWSTEVDQVDVLVTRENSLALDPFRTN